MSASPISLSDALDAPIIISVGAVWLKGRCVKPAAKLTETATLTFVTNRALYRVLLDAVGLFTHAQLNWRANPQEPSPTGIAKMAARAHGSRNPRQHYGMPRGFGAPMEP